MSDYRQARLGYDIWRVVDALERQIVDLTHTINQQEEELKKVKSYVFHTI